MPKFRSLKINPMVQEAEFSKLARRFIAIKKAEGLSERTIAEIKSNIMCKIPLVMAVTL
jgi:hypothetical protein